MRHDVVEMNVALRHILRQRTNRNTGERQIMARTQQRKSNRKPVALALQGGGAHGAFTWGVLDYLLEDNRLEITAISGTSAGAMNAAVLADGYVEGGIDGARAALDRFWRRVSEVAMASPIQRSPLDVLTGNWSLDFSPSYVAFDLLSRVVSPYQLNPLNINPLRDIIEEMIDFDHVHRCKDIQVFVCATNVHTGKIRVFKCGELTSDAIMASACLPQIFQAVEIDGVPYWDGGFMGNPPIYPLFYNTPNRDVVLVQINPIERKDTPQTAREIFNRVNEISFNATLLREMRAIDFVTRLIDDGQLDPEKYRRVYMHRIDADEEIKPLSSSSKLNAEWAFLAHLKEIGRRAAKSWLDANFDKIGKSSTLDVKGVYG